jgi:DNA-directed RNA polymerase subunit beta
MTSLVEPRHMRPIVKGKGMPEPGLPESFNVLLHELKGLGLKISLQ